MDYNCLAYDFNVFYLIQFYRSAIVAPGVQNVIDDGNSVFVGIHLERHGDTVLVAINCNGVVRPVQYLGNRAFFVSKQIIRIF